MKDTEDPDIQTEDNEEKEKENHFVHNNISR
jgi:hypothetical protein